MSRLKFLFLAAPLLFQLMHLATKLAVQWSEGKSGVVQQILALTELAYCALAGTGFHSLLSYPLTAATKVNSQILPLKVFPSGCFSC